MRKIFIFLLLLCLNLNADISTLEKYALENIKDKDWIILTSGELVVGEFYNIYDDRVEFKSTRFKEQSIRFKYIKKLKTNKIVSINIENMSTFYGYMNIDDDKIVLSLDDKVSVFHKSQIVSAAEVSNDWNGNWKSEMTLNMGFKSGNTDQTDIGTIINLKRKVAESQFSVNYIANFSKNNYQKTIDNHRLNMDYKIYHTTRFFWKPIFGEFYKDEFSNIKRSYNLGTGLGYEVYNSDKLEVDISGGPGFRETIYDSYELGEKSKNSTPMLSVTTDLEYEINSDLDFDLTYAFELLNKDNGSYTHHILSKLDHDFYKDFDLAISFIWDRIEDPTKREDGTTPEKDNYQLLFGLGYEF
jgi:putative salt-induced outer membrane protein YdiY